LVAAKSDVDIATAQKIISKEFPNPTLAASVAKISVDGRYPNQGNSFWSRDYDSIAAVNQLFEIGGKRKSRQLSAEAGLAGACARLGDARRTLDLAVSTAYAAAVQADANVRVLRESAASLRREAEIAAVRLKAGDISTADKSRIEISAQQFELDAQSAEIAARTARINLELLLGVPKAAGEVTLADQLEDLANAPLSTAEAAPGFGRADLAAAEQALKKAEADLRLQKAERIPDPTILAQYEHQPPTQPNTLGFGVSFPLPLWNRNRGEIRAAEAARDQARTQVEKVRAQIAADIATARFNYENAMKRWQSYRDQLRPKSEGIRQTVAFAYEKGGASLLDLLSAERDDNNVRLTVMQTANDAVVAAAALKAATEVMKLQSFSQ
jgi:cobalt-zinc-cadmium efflux system outer membrane protein